MKSSYDNGSRNSSGGDAIKKQDNPWMLALEKRSFLQCMILTTQGKKQPGEGEVMLMVNRNASYSSSTTLNAVNKD